MLISALLVRKDRSMLRVSWPWTKETPSWNFNVVDISRKLDDDCHDAQKYLSADVSPMKDSITVGISMLPELDVVARHY